MSNLYVIKRVDLSPGDANVVFINGVNGVVMDDSFEKYMFVGAAITTSIVSPAYTYVVAQVSHNSGSSYYSDYNFNWLTSQNIVSVFNGVDTVLRATLAFGSDTPYSFNSYLYNISVTGVKLFYTQAWGDNYEVASVLRQGTGINRINNTAPLNAIKFYPRAGTFSSGSITMYGILDGSC